MKLTNKSVIFKWGDDQHRAFETLRQRLCEALVFILLKPMNDKTIYYDASLIGLGKYLCRGAGLLCIHYNI